jgi:hypothetical protein
METLVKYNSFLELGNIEFEGFDNDDPEHRTSINNLLENWEKNCFNFDFNIIGNTDLKSPLFGFIKSCVYTDTKIKMINEKFENKLEEHVFDIRHIYKKNKELTDEVKMIKKYVNGYMEETCSLKNDLAFGINVKISCLEAELVNQQKINQYLLTRIYVIFAVLFFMFVMIIMIITK